MAFTLPCFRELQNQLGRSDALVELMDLAIRKFESEAHASGNVKHFIESASESFKVCVNFEAFPPLRHNAALLYITSVYELAEKFLHDFRREHIELYNNEWSGDGDKIDPLTVTLKNIDASKIPEEMIQLFHYYRLVRNQAAHPKKDKAEQLKASIQVVTQYLPIYESRFGKVSPNEFSKVNFDDFVLFTRLVKGLAMSMCLACEPSDDEWPDLLKLKKFNRFKLKTTRWNGAVVNHLRANYGFSLKEATWVAGLVH